jgi:hypothetical protein
VVELSIEVCVDWWQRLNAAWTVLGAESDVRLASDLPIG